MPRVKLRAHRRGSYVWYEISLPKDVVEALGWREGTELEVRIITYENKPAIVLYQT